MYIYDDISDIPYIASLLLLINYIYKYMRMLDATTNYNLQAGRPEIIFFVGQHLSREY